jgi:hypothetical protein
MTVVKPQVHASDLSQVNKCGIQWQRRKGARFGVWPEEEIRPPGIAMTVGTATHLSVATNLQNKIDTGQLITRGHAQQIAVDEVRRLVDVEGVHLAPSQRAMKKTTVDNAVDMVSRLALLHHQVLAPKLNPTAVEAEFVIELPNYPFDLAGTIDIKELGAIRDTKTAAQRPGPDHCKTVQMFTYSYAHLIEEGVLPERVTNDFLVKTKTPQLIVIPDQPTDAWTANLFMRLDRFKDLIASVKKGREPFQPAFSDPASWICTARYCGYHYDCPYWTGRE